MKDAYIKLQNVNVSFKIFSNNQRSIKNKILNFTTGGKIIKSATKHDQVVALNNINLSLSKGDRLGIIGHNGSGKTTLLRVLSGIYVPVSGFYESNGTISSLLDISMGLDIDATGYENIYIRGLLHGLSKDEIRKSIDEIKTFSGLGDFINYPVNTYSSGMMMRLAFSISTTINSQILILDEWLSVGDEDFSKKAEKRLKDMVNKSEILVFASHNFDMVRSICNKIITLEHGNVLSYKENNYG